MIWKMEIDNELYDITADTKNEAYCKVADDHFENTGRWIEPTDDTICTISVNKEVDDYE